MSLFERFESLIDEIDELKKLHWKSPNESVWIKKVERFLKKEFGENSDYYKQFHDKVYRVGISIVTSSTTFFIVLYMSNCPSIMKFNQTVWTFHIIS